MACIWKVQPVSQQQFQAGIAIRTAKHYFGTIIHSNNKKKMTCNNAFPPLFVKQRVCYQQFETEFNDNHRGLIPYLDMLSDYYAIIHQFICQLWKFIESDILTVLLC